MDLKFNKYLKEKRVGSETDTKKKNHNPKPK